jgi:hypothetical protein
MPSSGVLRRVALVRTDVPPKSWFLQVPHGVTSQKTAFFTIAQLLQTLFFFEPNISLPFLKFSAAGNCGTT